MPHTSHRHYVILPLLALSILGTGMASRHVQRSGLTAITTNAGVPDAAGELIEHSSGLRGLLLDGAQMDLSGDVPVLEQGSALILVDTPVQLGVGAFTIIAVDGGIHVTKSTDTVTVAALTAPTLVTQGAARIAVPAGTQWRMHGTTVARWENGVAAWMDARSVTPLPKRFLAEQRDALLAIPARNILPVPQVDAPAFAEGALPELPQALERRREAWGEVILGALRTHVEANDAMSVQELLLRPDLTAALSAKRSQSVVSVLLFHTPRPVAMQQHLLPLLIKDPDLWLLLSLHPAVSTVVWTLPAPVHSSEADAVRLLAFPFSDIGDTAGHAMPWGRWEAALLSSVLAASDPKTVAGELIVRLGELALERETAGYPERARHIADALHALSGALTGSLSGEAQDMLDTLSRLDRVDVLSLTKPVSAVLPPREAASTVTEHEFDANLVEAQARALLQYAGAAFSLQTRIIPVSASRAHVENIVFAGKTRDHTLTFILDVGRGTVSEINEGTEAYPYALPMEAFMEWVRH